MSILTIDVGTSSLKVALYTGDGRVAGSATHRYAYRSEQPGWAEVDPEQWWQALQASMEGLAQQGLVLDEVEALSFTGQMHTAVLLDATGRVVPPTVLWLDRRAAAETEELQALLHLPPYQLNSTFTLPKLLWLHRHRPEVLARTRTLLWPKDYVRFRMTGEICTDLTEPGGAALLDWSTRGVGSRLEAGAPHYATERLALVGLDATVLPPIRPASAGGGRLLPDVARQWGLPLEAEVVVGMGDAAALFGAAPPRPGRVACSLGSSSMVFVPVGPDQPPDPLHRLHIYPFGPYPMLGGVSSTTGRSLTWAHAALGQGKPFEACLAEALEVAPGAGGVCFVPFLAGERNPYWSDGLRGGFYGLQLAHDGRHLLRAVMEGVAYSLRVFLDLFDEMGVAVDEVALAGGGASTPGWPQIIADVCQRPVLIYAGSETVTRVLFALCKEHLGQGSFADSLLRTFDAPVRWGAGWKPALRIIEPRHEFRQVYEDGYRTYRALCKFALEEAGE